MDAFGDLKALLERRRVELGWSREQLARMARARNGAELSPADIRYMETSCRLPPDRDKLRAAAVTLGLTYEQVTETITLGLERW